jgi:hypothetical protein
MNVSCFGDEDFCRMEIEFSFSDRWHIEFTQADLGPSDVKELMEKLKKNEDFVYTNNSKSFEVSPANKTLIFTDLKRNVSLITKSEYHYNQFYDDFQWNYKRFEQNNWEVASE